jgi:hypothetical protein
MLSKVRGTMKQIVSVTAKAAPNLQNHTDCVAFIGAALELKIDER